MQSIWKGLFTENLISSNIYTVKNSSKLYLAIFSYTSGAHIHINFELCFLKFSVRVCGPLLQGLNLHFVTSANTVN